MSGTPSLKPNTYKLKVGGVSPRCGIEQIRGGLHPKWIIPSKEEVRLSTTHDSTPLLRPSAYKSKVGGVVS